MEWSLTCHRIDTSRPGATFQQELAELPVPMKRCGIEPQVWSKLIQ